MKKEKIYKRLKEHYNRIKDRYEVVGVFLYGSQNYGLDIYTDEYTSDIDSKAIVLPSLDDIINKRKPLTKVVEMDNGEHIEVKDIRLMFECIEKQNINFVEILFTDYRIINKKYKDLIDILVSKREEIARLNQDKALRCMVGMSGEKLKALDHPYPSIIDKIERFGYDPKQLHHILRINDFIKKYISGLSYKKCLIPDDVQYLLDIKGGCLDKESATLMANEVDKETYFLREKVKGIYEFDDETYKFMKEIKGKFIKRFIVEDLKEEAKITKEVFVPKKVFVISDTHFYHDTIIENCYRPFKSVEEMNNLMINNWNNVVTDKDVVYILGDFSLGNAVRTMEVLKQLKGKKVLVRGNHDLFVNEKKFDKSLFLDIVDYKELVFKDKKYVMCHYPIAAHYGNYKILYGHLHNEEEAHRKISCKIPNSFNVGVDVNNYTPVDIETI